MSTPSPKPRTLLAADARPIPIDELDKYQRERMREFLDLVNAMRDENRGRPADPIDPPPWAQVELHRTRRVLMLDAERGAGKTSILLTLLDGWNRQETLDPWKPEDTRVRPLPRQDFDPHPENIHAYAWLVLAFRDLARWIDNTRRVSGRDKSLTEKWGELYGAALLGWSDRALDGAIGKDLDAFVVDQLQGQNSWQDLPGKWKHFLDEVLKELEHLNELSPSGLLALPIDDLDLHPSMAGQLLLAVRLLYHPRLLIVLAGEQPHLQEVFQVELYQKALRGGSLPGSAPQQRFETAGTLSRALIDKVIPPSHRISLRRLRLEELAWFVLNDTSVPETEAIQLWQSLSAAQLLNMDQLGSLRPPSPAVLVGNTRRGTQDNPVLLPRSGIAGASLHLLLSAGSLGLQRLYTRRDASNLRALAERNRQHAAHADYGDRASFADELLRRARRSDGAHLFTQEGRIPKDGPIKMSWKILRTRLDQAFSVQSSHDVSIRWFPAIQLTSTDITGVDDPDVRARDVLLSIWSLAHERLHVDVKPSDDYISPQVVTYWESKDRLGRTLPVFWPWVPPGERLRFNTIPSGIQYEGCAALWLNMNAGINDGSTSLPDALASSFSLIKTITSNALLSERPAERQHWFTDWFPILAAPEFALPEEQQRTILEFFHSKEVTNHFKIAPAAWKARWERSRDKVLRQALVGASTVVEKTTRRASGRTDVNVLKGQIKSAFSSLPWYTYSTKSPSESGSRSKSKAPRKTAS